MSKRLFKWLIILPTVFIFMYAFSSSYSLQNIDNLNYVVAVLIDEAKDPNMINVTFEFIDVSSFSSDSSSKDSKPILDTITATSIDSAINIMNAYSAKGINLSTCEVIIFSDEIAKKGIYNHISDLINSTQIRPSANVLVIEGSAKYYVENSTSPLEKILTKYYDLFPNSSKYTGYTSDLTIGEFYENLKNPNIGNTAILGGTNESSISNKEKSQSSGQSGSSSSESGSSNKLGMSGSSKSDTSSSSSDSTNKKDEEKEDESPKENEKKYPFLDTKPLDMVAGSTPITGLRGSETFGLAVFKSDAYIGKLTAGETLCRSIIDNECDLFSIAIPYPPGESTYIVLDVYRNSDTDIKVSMSDDTPIITLDISLGTRISSILKDINYSDYKELDKIELASEEFLKEQISNYLNKTSKEYKVDINHFFDKIKKKYLTNSDLEQLDWQNKYPNAEFYINLDTNVVSSLLVQNN